jgi:hypothetical protein
VDRTSVSLREWADFVFEHEGWHVSLWDSVKDLTPAQAIWAPAPSRNSIWQIVDHVALWKDDGARRILKEPPRPTGWHKDIDWCPIPAATEPAWQESLRVLREAHARVAAALGTHGESDLATIRGLIAHDSYHSGQICYLRALQGVPVRVW